MKKTAATKARAALALLGEDLTDCSLHDGDDQDATVERRKTPRKQKKSKGPELWISIDNGTKRLSIAVTVKKPGVETAHADIHVVLFDRVEFYAPQQAAWDSSGAFVFGYDVERAIVAGRVKREDVIEYWKLYSRSDPATKEIRSRIQARLGAHTIEELNSAYIRAVVDKAIAWTKSSYMAAPGFTDQGTSTSAYRSLASG